MSEHANKTRTDAATRRAKTAAPDLYELEADSIRALAHPKRLLIVDLLSDGSERTVSELQAESRLSQSNLSQNLAILRTAGLLNARRDGNNVLYSVSDPRVLKAVTLLRAVLERQMEDKDFLVERNAFKTKERAKNATILGLVIAVGLMATTFLGAASMPLFMGGDLGDVAEHANMMLSDPRLDTFVQTCRDVLTEPRAMTTTEATAAAA